MDSSWAVRIEVSKVIPKSADRMPIKHDADREHYLEGFRRAGLD